MDGPRTCCDAINSTYLLLFRRRAKRRRKKLLLGVCLEAATPLLEGLGIASAETFHRFLPLRDDILSS